MTFFRLPLFALLLLIATQATCSEVQEEHFSDTVSVVIIAVKDAVTDTTETVKHSMHVGAEAAKDFIATTAQRVKIALQEARVKDAQQKAFLARQLQAEAEQLLAQTRKKLKEAQAALASTQQALSGRSH